MRSYEYIAEPTETGFSGYLPEVDGCVSTGATPGELEAHLRDAIIAHLDLPLGERIDLYQLPAVVFSAFSAASTALRPIVDVSFGVTEVTAMPYRTDGWSTLASA